MADPQTLRQIAQSRTPFSAWLGVVLLFSVFGLIVLAIIGPSPRASTYEQKRAEARMEKLKKLREEDAKSLTTYGWVDKSKGIARIPIERAMELALADLAQKKPAAAGPIATPAPPAPAATGSPPAAGANPPGPAPATQPGPSASPAASPAPAAVPPVSPSPAATPSAPGSPLPVRGKSPEGS
jgi:hypothetical protein